MPQGNVLYTFPFSHYCVSAERMLAFKRLPYRPVRAAYHDRQELIRATRQDYIPTLIADGRVVLWHQIPDFLEKLRPTPTLYPGDQRALAGVLENWGHQVLEERVWRAVVTRVPPRLSSDVERWVFEEFQTRARGPWHVLESRRAEFETEAVEYLTLVDGMVAGRPWVLGAPSLADFGLYGSLSPWLAVGNRIPAELRSLAAWVRRVEAIPSTAVPDGPARTRRRRA
jgi:glutathione S-transferase